MSENIVMLTFLFMSPNLRLNEQQIVIKDIKILILSQAMMVRIL